MTAAESLRRRRYMQTMKMDPAIAKVVMNRPTTPPPQGPGWTAGTPRGIDNTGLEKPKEERLLENLIAVSSGATLPFALRDFGMAMMAPKRIAFDIPGNFDRFIRPTTRMDRNLIRLHQLVKPLLKELGQDIPDKLSQYNATGEMF